MGYTISVVCLKALCETTGWTSCVVYSARQAFRNIIRRFAFPSFDFFGGCLTRSLWFYCIIHWKVPRAPCNISLM